MTAERSSEDNDGHQVRTTIGLAARKRPLQRARSVRHREPFRMLLRGSYPEGFIDFEALVAAAAAGPYLPPTATPRAIGSAAWADGLLLSFAQAALHVRTGAGSSCSRPNRSSICRARTSAKAIDGVLRRELSRARQFDRSTSA